ncbi:hypothetical protein M2451_001972 [Dysgonomonas sp. PFB1-18]|uniref:hypothetical protein n=1 Tax=unclassified Dysgonomonas TaxID=2630389 RepID=UPI002474C689|nr:MULTISPECIES: hypothetical protein [unclassified Dysgonomonas]MDH6309606.1 hypothetical protein [Dysgonomonas sp. PF1-14]MDH6339066.1 hypothetical protein [Dysgonomonas sp. PF1-16]MDH6380648.1 hypothetical protein [Dysgonomonas sp. PFB1-18]MDH6398144.1 hypothetical protein [Dysgonomonas sp. PF1-23]
MRKLIPFIFVCALCLGFAACGGDDDEEETYFRVKGATEDLAWFTIELENNVTLTTLNIESNTNWELVKNGKLLSSEGYWFVDEVIEPNELFRLLGDGNKTVNIYLEKNINPSDKTHTIKVYYGNNRTKTISIIQKGTGSAN